MEFPRAQSLDLYYSNYNIYVNDISLSVQHSQLNMYADDTELHYDSVSLSSLNDHLQFDLDRLEIWMIANRLKLNSSKSVCMIIGPWQRIKNLSLSIQGCLLSCVDTTKYLGLIIDKHLTWQDHLKYVGDKIRMRSLAIRRFFPLPTTLMARLFRAFVTPIIDYCDIVWMIDPIILKIDKIHRRYYALLHGKGFDLTDMIQLDIRSM